MSTQSTIAVPKHRLLFDSTAKQLGIFSSVQICVCYLGCTADKDQLLSTIDNQSNPVLPVQLPQLRQVPLRESKVKSGHCQIQDAAELTSGS